MIDKTVVIGVGAQKGGTSWLHYFLRQHPQCALSPIKELHYFDCIELKHHAVMERALQRKRARLADGTAETAALLAPRTVAEAQIIVEAWAELMTHTDVDLDAYRAFLMRDAADAKVVGEVTPAYAILSRASFQAMREIAERTKFIFVMRDPVARLWSNLRMRAHRHQSDSSEMLGRIEQDLEKLLSGGLTGIARRSDYRRTLDTMSATLAAENMHVDFFEELFDGGAARVCDFLDIDQADAPVETNVNEGKRLDMPAEMGRLMYNFLAPQYDFVRDTIGRLPAKWIRTQEVYA